MTVPTASATQVATLGSLTRLREQGWLRRLDVAFAEFISSLDPTAGPALTVAAALLSRLESLGHTQLPLPWLETPQIDAFGWPSDVQADLEALWRGLPSYEPGWLAELRASPSVLDAASSNPVDLGQPLVLDGPMLYLRRFWRDQRTIDEAVRERCSTLESVDELALRDWIGRLFDGARGQIDQPTAASALNTQPDWQRMACALALRGRFTIVTGGPGTGKTFTAARLLALLLAMSPRPETMRIALAAPTGKAAARLKQSIDQSLAGLQDQFAGRIDLSGLTRQIGAAQTLHALLGSRPDSRRFRHNAGHPLAIDVVIVDEASMIHLEMMAALLRATPAKARVILLGDKDQLASVEPGAVLGQLCAGAEQGHYTPETAAWLERASGESLPAAMIVKEPQASSEWRLAPSALSQQTVMLRQSRRFDGPLGELAKAVNSGASESQLLQMIDHDTSGSLWRARSPITPEAISDIAVLGRTGTNACYRDYCELLRQSPTGADHETKTTWIKAVIQAFDRFRVLCAVREGPWGVAGLNLAIERRLAAEGLLQLGGLSWYPGRPVMVTRNDRALGVFNGDIGITLPAQDRSDRLKVYFLDGDALRAVSVNRLNQVETAYAMTVHKSQGSEFEHTVLVLPGRTAGQLLSRELVYTGITRARKALSLIVEWDGVLGAAVGRGIRG